MERVKITDVAKAAGVSPSTVSNYINKKFGNMSETTKEKIQMTIEELGYYPSVGAQMLSKKSKSKTICMIIPHNISYTFSTLFFAEVMKGIGDAVEKYDYKTMLYASRRDKIDNDIEYLKGIWNILVDGFLVFDVHENDAYIQELDKCGIPYVCFGKYGSGQGTKYVASDHERGSYESILHLINHGHKRIAIITGPKGMILTHNKINGYKEALLENNIPFDDELVIYSKDDSEDVRELCKNLLDIPNPPTAFYASYVHMNGIYRAVCDKGMSIPDDVAVILSEYFPSYYHDVNNYTYVKTHVYELGTAAVKKLLRIINAREEINDKPEVLPVELVIGETCGCKRT